MAAWSGEVADFSWYLRTVEGAREFCGISFIKALFLFMRSPPS